MGLVLTIKERALALGFDLVGIAPPTAWHDLEFARRWVEKGYGGEMRYLANSKRYDPRLVLPSVKSVVCIGLVYNTPHPYSTEAAQAEDSRQEAESSRQKIEAKAAGPEDEKPRAWISRYAWGRDYHGVVRTKLEQLCREIETLSPGAETRAFVDTGPVVERAFARYSGIGWMGKNTCLINEQKGSWFFLGVILTSLELEPNLPAPDRCGSCTRCLDACPTGALVEPCVMDASRCISYFTIELKGAVPPEFRSAIGANVFGCDICQDVCPWNSKRSAELSVVRGPKRKVATTTLPEFQPLQIDCKGEPSCSPSRRLVGEGLHGPPEQIADPKGSAPAELSLSLFTPPLEALASLSEDDFRRLFAQSPIKRAKYRGWLRNLCVAVGNSGNRNFLPWLERLCNHADPIVREHAVWAVECLSRNEPPRH